MTTIAWDGKTLAADKCATFSGLRCTVTKIYRVDDKIVGFSGSAAQAMEMLAWLQADAKPDEFPESQRNADDAVAAVVVSPGPVIDVYERTPYPIRMEDAVYACGSGRDFALTAMFLGHSASEAVLVAAEFDTGTGYAVDMLELG